MRAQVHEQAAVRVTVAELTGRAYDERGLADTGRTVHRQDRHGSGRVGPGQLGELCLPADEAAGVARQFIDGAAGPGPGGLCGGAGGGGTEQVCVVAAQHRFVQPVEFFPRIDAELVTQPYAHVLIGVQGLRLAFTAVQGPHPQRQQRLVVPVGRGQGREVVQGVAEPAEQDQALEPVHPQPSPALPQPLPLGLREQPRHAGQGLAPEQGERRGQLVDGPGQLAGRLRTPRLGAPLGQLRHIEPDPVDDEAVPALSAADHRLRRTGALRVERPAQRIDVTGQHFVAGRGRLRPPHPVHQPLMAHHGPPAEQQRGQHGLPFDGPQIQRFSAPARP